MRRLLLLGALLYLLLLVGIAAQDRGFLALAIPLLVYLAAALPFGPEPLRLTIRRSVSPDRTMEGVPVRIRLTVTNEGSELEQIVIADPVLPKLELVEGKPVAAAALGPDETLECEYTVRPRRGLYDFESVQVVASDRLGLSQRRAARPAPGHLTVLPRLVRLRQLPIRPLRTRGHAGPVPARQGGSGVDFYGVREYQVGDPRRWINWRVSARHPSGLFTNEFEQERIADVGLILDARARSDVRAQEDSLFEYALRAAAALADTFLRDGSRVGLLVFGQYVDWTFPGYGKLQRERILRALARAETGESRIFDSLEYIPTRLFPARSQLVLVSPVTREDVPVLRRLRARGYQLLVIRPDSISYELQALAPSQAVDLATRLLRAERALVRRQLLHAGVQVVDWSVHLPLDQAIHASLGRVPVWFRAVGVER